MGGCSFVIILRPFLWASPIAIILRPFRLALPISYYFPMGVAHRYHITPFQGFAGIAPMSLSFRSLRAFQARGQLLRAQGLESPTLGGISKPGADGRDGRLLFRYHTTPFPMGVAHRYHITPFPIGVANIILLSDGRCPSLSYYALSGLCGHSPDVVII